MLQSVGSQGINWCIKHVVVQLLIRVIVVHKLVSETEGEVREDREKERVREREGE